MPTVRISAHESSTAPPAWLIDLGTFADEVRFLLEIRMKQYADQTTGRVLQAFIGAAAEDEIVDRSFQTSTSIQRTGTSAMVRRAMARGEVDPGWSVSDIVTLIAAPTMFRAIIENSAPDQGLVDTVIDVVTKSVRQPPGQPRIRPGTPRRRPARPDRSRTRRPGRGGTPPPGRRPPGGRCGREPTGPTVAPAPHR